MAGKRGQWFLQKDLHCQFLWQPAGLLALDQATRAHPPQHAETFVRPMSTPSPWNSASLLRWVAPIGGRVLLNWASQDVERSQRPD